MTRLTNTLLHALAPLTLALTGCASVSYEPPGTQKTVTRTPVIVTMHVVSTTPISPPPVQAPTPSPTPPTTLAILSTAPTAEPIQTSSQIVASIEPPTDLWDRIRRGFAMPDLNTELVNNRQRWYVGQPDYMQRMAGRSRKYLFHIVEELELRNMPTELALLPFVESAFNPQAVSSAKAAGIWQFMPATGKTFDLKQNVFRDDRRDVLASTRAALDYLQKLYAEFGDWHLALASYNWGEGNVRRAIAKNKSAGLGTGYLDLRMPLETQQYVPKLQAVKNIVASLRTELPLIENHPYFQTVRLKRDIDVALAAKLAEIKLDDFKALNPSLNRPVILAAGMPEILLPWDNAAVFQRNLQSHNSGQLASWTAWTASKTVKPSEAAHSVGMSEFELRSLNNIPGRVLIRAGSTLLITRSSKSDRDVSQTIADGAQLSLAPEVVLQRRLVKVGKHESVASVAKRYRLAASDVAQWNKVSEATTFKAGQRVVVFLPAKGKATVRTKTATRSATHANKRVAKHPTKPVRVARH